MRILREWFERQFSNPQVVLLTVLLVAFTAAIIFTGQMLAPLIAALVIAFLLQSLVERLTLLGAPQTIAMIVVFTAFMAALLFAVTALLPLLLRQLSQLLQQLPAMITEAQRLLMRLPEEYPGFFTEDQVRRFIASIGAELVSLGQQLLTYSVSSLLAVVAMVTYGILVPFLVFFLVKDKDLIIGWLTQFLPANRELALQVWHDVEVQIANYVRGKVLEICIVGIVTYLVMAMLGLQYAALMAVLTGLSVLIPYIGAAVVTFPVAIVAYFQFGLTADFVYVIAAYGVIQAIDGNVLAPLLLSEAVNIHPVAIIVAILFFGGLWGFWGVFFAIPLASVVQAVIKAWPSTEHPPAEHARAPPDVPPAAARRLKRVDRAS